MANPDTKPTQLGVAHPGHAWHHAHFAEVLQILDCDPKTGLSGAEVAARREKFGPNTITPRPDTPSFIKFLLQFHQPLIYILLAAAAVTAFLGEWVDSCVILVVVFVNSTMGYLQESKAERAIASLSSLLTTMASVRRGGDLLQLPSEELVPGDIVLLEAGDRVPADLRLIHAKNLQIDESGLTGESLPAHKHTDTLAHDTLLADRHNLAFSGTLVTAGQGEGVTWATGDATETGKIARLISSADSLSTPLTKKIQEFSRFLLAVILLMAAATIVVGMVRGESFVPMFMAAVALAVGAIPEGLPAAMTIVLAIGVSRMARRNAIIRKLPAVETLGSTTVICSDKTGTLTENQMTVKEMFTGGTLYTIDGAGYQPEGDFRLDGAVIDPAGHPALTECLRAGALCNDARIGIEGGRPSVHGDPTEAALLVVAQKAGLLHAEVCGAMPRIDAIPFAPEHMFHATLHDLAGGRVIYKVGAAERIVERCADSLGANGETTLLDKAAVHAAGDAMAARGLRVLAAARRAAEPALSDIGHHHVAGGLTFLGLFGMIDPPRPEAIAAVRSCQSAGIMVKMITGDHLVTAKAIAQQIGLHGVTGNDDIVAISGGELEQMDASALVSAVEGITVFARVAPEQKLRLVRALQARGHVVAMTGDGVNDAPALKQADIGIAMGRSGTEVAKGAADMILADDNFATIEAAVEEGRGTFDNLTKFIVWSLPTNGGEALIILGSIVLGVTLPIMPVQLLWVNMMTAILLGLMLVFEPREKDLMQRPPRTPGKPILSLPLLMRTGLVSLCMFCGGLWLFFWELWREGETLAEARTIVVNLLVLVELVYLFNCRSLNHSMFSIGFFSNRWAVLGALIMIASQLAFTYLPLMNALFHSAPIDFDSWLRILFIAALTFAAVEFEKWIRFGKWRAIGPVAEWR